VINHFYRICSILRRASNAANCEFEKSTKRKNQTKGTARLRGEQTTLQDILLTVSKTPQVKLILDYKKKIESFFKYFRKEN
jgi:Fic family protein